MLGKVSPDDLAAHVFGKTGMDSDTVSQGPEYGEDAAAIEVSDGTLVVSSDPISLAIDRVGTLGVHVACNDVAASGADPKWLTSVVFLPGESDQSGVLETITDQMDEAARAIDVSIVGGHSEYNPSLERPLLSLTCLGMAPTFVPSGGAEPGDRVILANGAGIEGTAILATDFREELLDAGIDPAILDRAETFYNDISVIDEARVLRQFATAMHDPTEGGLIDGLLEVASASGVSLHVESSAVPLRAETREICQAMDVDPLRIFGSGALLGTVPESDLSRALEAIDEIGVEVAAIGEVRESADSFVEIGEYTFSTPVRDDLYRMFEESG